MTRVRFSQHSTLPLIQGLALRIEQIIETLLQPPLNCFNLNMRVEEFRARDCRSGMEEKKVYFL